MSDTWGKGAKNNTIGWGSAACTTTNDWGKSQKDSSVAASWSGDTDISGCSGAALSITYSSSAFCEDASDPTPTVTDNVGAGTFSSTAGLVFVSTTTGEVDISASTSGATYVITYTDTDAATATFSLTVNALDNAAFAYSASSYDPTASNPTPTITGLAGGTFSAGSGLVFVDSGSNTGSSTGEINLSASTIASYTITYTTAGTCPNTSTQTVEIAALAQVNNVYSMEFDGVGNNKINCGIANTYNILSLSAWVKPNSPVDYAGIFGTRNGTSSTLNYLLTIDNTNKFRFIINDGGNKAVLSNDQITSSWTHVVGVADGNNIHLYINGVKQTATQTYGTIATTNDSLMIGAQFALDTTFTFNGSIDEAAIFNVALTDAEILSIYNATETGKTADLNDLTTPPVKWYRMGD